MTKMLEFLWRIVVMRMEAGLIVLMHDIGIDKFEIALLSDEYELRRDVYKLFFGYEGVDADREYGDKLLFLEEFAVLLPDINFLFQLYLWVFVNHVNLEYVRTDAFLFLRPILNQLNYVLAIPHLLYLHYLLQILTIVRLVDEVEFL